MKESAVGLVTIRRRDGKLVAGSHDLVQPGDADIIVLPSRDGAGPLGALGPDFTLCPPMPWGDGTTLYCALSRDWHVFPEPSASNSGDSRAQYLAVRIGNGEEQLLQFLPRMSRTSCHQHQYKTEVIAGLAGECYYHSVSRSGSMGAGRIVSTGVQFAPSVGHCLWTHERPAINIITMCGRGVLLPMTDRLVMDMSDHVPVPLPPYLRARNRLR